MLRGLLLLLNMTGIPRLIFRLMLDRRVPLKLKLVPIAAIAYLILPFDLVPDMFLALGRIDDLLAILVSLAVFLGAAPRDVVSEHMRNTGTFSQTRGRGSQADQTVIDGKFRVVDDEKK